MSRIVELAFSPQPVTVPVVVPVSQPSRRTMPDSWT
jgi:hypothetical protein